MTTAAIVLVAATFLASAVEGVEALTIVLAVGVTRGWRSALIGAGAAGIALAVIVAALGPALTAIPLNGLRLVIGALLLIFGLQWLRKAILRAAGYKALHDEDAIYRREVEEAQQADQTVLAGMDWYSFTLSFKGVFLEGLEVAFIVLTFGSSQGSVPLAATGAGAAVILVILAGLLVHAPLSRVPENTLKFAVGVMLITFGMFWGGEGAGVAWPGEDAAILVMLPSVLALALALVSALRWQRARAFIGQLHA
ncbi:MAG TPA: hypothetical protein VFL82_08550 [Thermomicrobiales bacterium]|jgi:uncharacterized membrane protein|nr:hypothetical protein [Thermomicrobiales bacterium]